MVRREFHYLFAALIWASAALMITTRGITAYCSVPQRQLWWVSAITVVTLVSFFFIFRRVVSRYIDHIAALPDMSYMWNTFSLRGWTLLLFMMGLGIMMRCLPNIPQQFTASFYSGLGPMLLLYSLRFLSAICTVGGKTNL
jgi:hypothetical protein